MSKLHYLDDNGKLTKEALEQLQEYFEPEEIQWKPQIVKDDKATVIAYADARVYHERLDKVFGPENWSCSISFATAPFILEKQERKNKKGEVYQEAMTKHGHKLFCIAVLSINGLGEKSSTGESETDNENAATVSEAQAFKRACSMLGIGRYLYSMPKQQVGYKFGKFSEMPILDERFLPKKKCTDCHSIITDFRFTKDGVEKVMDTHSILDHSLKNYGRAMCADCLAEAKKRKEVAKNEN